MKFKCETRENRFSKWHRKFAWLPVRLGDNDCRWLEFIERKGTLSLYGWDYEWDWEFREYKKENNVSTN